MRYYLVVGLGKTGHSIARYLQRRNLPFIAYDTRAQTDATESFRTAFPSAELFLGSFPESKLSEISEIIVSPGVPLETPCLLQAKALGIPVYGDMECLAREIKTDVIAITGTNGKSTVTTLVGMMAQAFGKKTAIAGNIGAPVLDLLADDVDYEIWVLELSSFQLDLVASLQPKAATILNISPDHLDRHHTLDAYVAAKQRVYHHAQYKLYNRDDLVTQPLTSSNGALGSFGSDTASGQWGFVCEQDEIFLAHDQERILSVNELKLKGRHNWTNALAACALAHQLGISFDIMRQVLTTFAGLPHRTQWIRTLNAVDWINDSKGTNIGATQSSIVGIGGTLSGKIVLIAGGQGKGADFRMLRECVTAYVHTLILLGEDTDKLDAALGDIVPVMRAASLEDAVNLAQKNARTGDVVLLSPACASFDMFRDFNQRGDFFADLVEAL